MHQIFLQVSETQTAECRSTKPNAAGSIPVAHSEFFRLCSSMESERVFTKLKVASSSLVATAKIFIFMKEVKLMFESNFAEVETMKL